MSITVYTFDVRQERCISVCSCIYASARAHRGRDRDVFQVNAFGSSGFARFSASIRAFRFSFKLLGVEGNFTDWSVDLTCFVQTVFDFTGFDFLNGFRNVKRYCTRFRVRHKAFTTEDTTQFTNFAIMSGVATQTSNSNQPCWILAIMSASPT